jgi:hypothetical protein
MLALLAFAFLDVATFRVSTRRRLLRLLLDAATSVVGAALALSAADSFSNAAWVLPLLGGPTYSVTLRCRRRASSKLSG